MGKVYSIVENDTGEICGEIDDKAYNDNAKLNVLKTLTERTDLLCLYLAKNVKSMIYPT